MKDGRAIDEIDIQSEETTSTRQSCAMAIFSFSDLKINVAADQSSEDVKAEIWEVCSCPGYSSQGG